MRSITRLLPLLILGMMILGLSSPVQAGLDASTFKFPEVKSPEWATGQAAKYAIKLNGIDDLGDSVGANLRLAIVGMEQIESKDFYWFEVDVDSLEGVPPQYGMMFQSFKMKFLVQNIPPGTYNDDPSEALDALMSGDILRKIVFQLNEETPQIIDFMTLQNLAPALTGQDFQGMMEEMEEQSEETGPPENFEFDTGTETITLPAGTFNNAPFASFAGSQEGATVNGKIHAHEKIPVTGLAKMAFDIVKPSENLDADITFELLGYETSGATSLITGTPVPFDMMKVMEMFGAMGGMEGMGGMGMGME